MIELDTRPQTQKIAIEVPGGDYCNGCRFLDIINKPLFRDELGCRLFLRVITTNGLRGSSIEKLQECKEAQI